MILESISDGFFSLDRQFRVTFVNETGARAFGQTRESMLGRVLWEIFPEAVGSDFERAYRKAMTEHVTASTESAYPPLNAWFEAHAYPSEDGISVFFRDVTHRKRVEQTLRENQTDLNWAQSVGLIGSWRLNVQRNELLWSDENHRIFGVPKGQPLSYETFLAIVHPEDRAVVDRKWTAALQDEPYDIEHRIVVGNTVKWVRERAELEFDAEGQLLGGFGITQDISDRKQSEKALHESEARFRLLANTAEQLLATGDPLAHVRDLAGRVMAHLDCHCFFNFLLVDEEMGRLRLNAWAGIPEEEARRIEWLDFGVAVCGCVARDGRRIVAEHIPTTPDVRTELVKSYGIKAYACHPLTGVDGRMLGTLSFGTRSRETFSPDDLSLMKAVTDQVAVAMVRMQNEQALRDSKEALRKANEDLEETVRKRTHALEESVAALKNEIVVRKKIQTQLRQLSRVFMDAADPIIIEDLSGKVVELNRAAEVEYGWSREELIGKPVDTLFLPERCHLAANLRERCCAGEEIRNWEGLRKARSGRIIPTLLTAFPLTDESGEVAFVATICKDISARKEMEEQLNEAQRHLHALSRKSLEALEADRRSVARELHDSIGGSLAAIKFGLEEVAGQAVRDPVGGSALLGTLVSHLADTIKETKRISANLRPLSIDDLGLLATIEWYTRQFSQRYEEIRLVPQIDVQEHEIPEDYKIVVYRVMQEALTNAAKHSNADTINIRLKKVSDGLELEVEDNGCGFDPHETLESSDGLSGYGLRGMKERVEICGGSISIHSRPGAGTHIRATLPI
jgi:PAS domain S-box-containing protein